MLTHIKEQSQKGNCVHIDIKMSYIDVIDVIILSK